MMFFDPSHRSWNDVKQAMVDCGLWAYILALHIVLNLDHGPWDGSVVHAKSSEALQKLIAYVGLASPLIELFREHILKDLGLGARRFEEDIDSFLLKHMKELFNTKARRVPLNRWMEVLRCQALFEDLAWQGSDLEFYYDCRGAHTWRVEGDPKVGG